MHLDASKLDDYPEIKAWFFKRKRKEEQDQEKLLGEILEAGEEKGRPDGPLPEMRRGLPHQDRCCLLGLPGRGPVPRMKGTLGRCPSER